MKRRKSKGGFKKSQVSGKMSKQVRLGVMVLAFLVTLILVGKTIDFIGSLNRPYAPDDPKSTRVGNWNSNKESLNLLVKSKEVSLLSLNPGEDSLTIFKIPAEAYINVSFGFGNWPIRSIYNLGQGENPPIGAKLLTTSIASAFGTPVDGYLSVQEEMEIDDLVGKMKQNPFTLWGILRQSRTDLSLREYWDFWSALRKVRADKVETIDLDESGSTVNKTLADGSKVYALDTYKLDVLIQKRLEDLNIREESLSIGIFNATSHSGLAEKASRLINNIGGRVVFTTNLDTPLQKSCIVGKFSYTTSRLSKIFSSTECAAGQLNLSPNTADVSIILGEDYFLRYNR